MIYTQTSTDGRFRLEMFCTLDENSVPHVYKRNHNYIRFYDLDNTQGIASVSIGGTTYVFDKSRQVVADNTDLFRSMSNGEQATFFTYRKGSATSSMSVVYMLHEGADPTTVAQTFPRDSYLCRLEDYKRIGYHLPNVMLSGASLNADTIWVCDVDGAIGGTEGLPTAGQFKVAPNAKVVGGVDYDGYIPIRDVFGTAALVRWDALAGFDAVGGFDTTQPIKQAVWEVASIKTTTTTEEYSTHGNGYYCHKTPSLALTLKIGGLDAYSFGYYSDIVTANDVRLILDPSQSLDDDESRVEVQTKEVKQQMNGNTEYFDLIIDVAYKGF